MEGTFMPEEPGRGKGERWAISIAAGLVIVITLLDYFGILHMTFMEKVLSPLILGILVVVLQLLQSQHEKITSLLHLVSDTQLESVSALELGVDPELRDVCSDYFHRLRTSIDSLRQGKVLIYGRENLRPCYNKTLEMHPNSTFYATSIASESYYWVPGSYEEVLKSFLGKGGTMERIFFVERDCQNLTDEEKRVIRKHLELGVKVFVVAEAYATQGAIGFFLVESKGRIGWISEITASRTIRTSTASARPDFTKYLIKSYRDLRKMATEVTSAHLAGPL
jgi:hypothetical protein